MRSIHAVFEQLFTDRESLTKATGWERKDVDTIDDYARSSVSYNFPTRAQCRAVMPENFINVSFVTVQNYKLAERYPLIAADRC